jgi:hypothetical protein
LTICCRCNTFYFAESRKKHCRKNGDNGDNNKQFDQRKTKPVGFISTCWNKNTFVKIFFFLDQLQMVPMWWVDSVNAHFFFFFITVSLNWL